MTFKIFPDRPKSSSLDHNKLRLMESYASLKSIKAVKVCLRFNLRVSIMFVKDEMWSIVLLPLRKPFCSSAKILLLSVHFVNLLLINAHVKMQARVLFPYATMGHVCSN